jgi:hypothetical protein
LRINGGAPVFTHPGPAQLGSDAVLTDQGWNKDGERIVHLGDALAKLTGNPADASTATFKVQVTSTVPGVLGIRRGGTESVQAVRRVVFGSDTSKDFAFADEGEVGIAIDQFGSSVTAGAGALIEQVRFTALGNLPPERSFPAVGPLDAGIADLVVNANRAAMVQLPGGTGLAELTAIRLPLSAASGGAEARVALWQSKKGASAEPFEPVPQGTSDPVQVAQASAEDWFTFPFKKAVPLDDTLTYWAAVLVSRGEVTWALATNAVPQPMDDTDPPVNNSLIRSGAPSGPWLPLPEPFVTGSSQLTTCRGRVRMKGHAKKDSPIAPALVQLGTAAGAPITPVVKGSDQLLKIGSPLPLTGATLRLISRVAGTITLRNLDVVSTA